MRYFYYLIALHKKTPYNQAEEEDEHDEMHRKES